MIKTYRLRNLLMTEQITGPELETLLQKKDYLGALYDLRNDRVWMADILQHPGAVTILAWSETAMDLVGDQAMPVVNKTTTAIAALVARLAGLPYEAYIDMAAVTASQTAMAAVVASQTAMAAVAASQTAMAAVNNSSIAKNAFFTSPKKRSRTVGNNTWVLWDIANGRGVFVRCQGQTDSSSRLRVDNTKDITVEGADFFKIIPYTSKLQISCYYSGAKVHYIPFGA